jgi:hypothetical protein
MLASVPSQHLQSDYRPRRNPKCESTSIDHALGWHGQHDRRQIHRDAMIRGRSLLHDAPALR